ncbi:MAG: LamG domain-containing protein [Planctomycetota bacterium]
MEGKSGGALGSDGRSARVTTPLEVDQSKKSRGVTLAAWVRPASAQPSERYVVSTDDGGSDWSLLRLGREWQVTSGEERRGTGLPVSVGRWQHVAAVFDPAAGTVRFYKNGAEAVVRELGYDKSAGKVTIGARTPEGGGCFDGAIDEVRVYKRALSADEVWVFYEVGVAGKR